MSMPSGLAPGTPPGTPPDTPPGTPPIDSRLSTAPGGADLEALHTKLQSSVAALSEKLGIDLGRSAPSKPPASETLGFDIGGSAPSKPPASTHGAPQDDGSADAKKAADIARLPPKLRARLLQRGILKEQDVAACDSSPAPVLSNAVNSTCTTLPGIVGAIAKVASPASMGAVGKAASRCVSPVVVASVSISEPARTVYSAAPTLNKEALAAARGESLPPHVEEQSVQSGGPTPSPANERAALVAEAGVAQAPVWIYKDGAMSQVNALPGGSVSSPASRVPDSSGTREAAVILPVSATSTHMDDMASGPPPGPPPGPPLPPGWVAVPQGDEVYYWNTITNQTSWEHPSGPPAKPKFTEEYEVLVSDVGKIIGARGYNLKVINASIGCTIKVPRGGGGKGGKGKDGKAKGKGKGKDDKGKGKGKEGARSKDVFEKDGKEWVKVTIEAESQHLANGGKRCLQVMLGYGRKVDQALQELGVEVKLPQIDDEDKNKGSGKKAKQDDVDPMDPASYSDAPQGTWSTGQKRPTKDGEGGSKKKRTSDIPDDPRAEEL